MDGMFAPELILEPDERVNLAQVQAMPGFAVIQKVFRSAVDTFVMGMINSKVGSEDATVCHLAAKTAAQLYTSFVERVNREVEIYVKTPRSTDKPTDMTSILDMDDIPLEAPSFFDNPDIWN